MGLELTLLSNTHLLERAAVKNVLECNYVSQSYGLALTEQQALELTQTVAAALTESGRVQLGAGITDKLIAVFCQSSYLTPQNYAQSLYELTRIFYEFKNEFPSDVSDNELLSMMYDAFEKYSGGSVDYLAEDLLTRMARNMRAGLPADYIERDTLDEDELYELQSREQRDDL